MEMRKWLNIYFNFSKREYNGLLVMLGLIGLIRMTPVVYDFFVEDKWDQHAEASAIRKLTMIKKNPKVMNRQPSVPGKDLKLFNFDPNTIGAQEWQLLGLSAKQAAVILRYRSKGGRYFKKEDLQKMYVISPKLYEKLIPYIVIEKTKEPGHHLYPEYTHPAKQKPALIALNTADTLQLLEIKGVGPAFARRIFNYRQRLGGFYKKEQLLEVYGLDSLKYNEIKDQLILDEQALTRINLNTAMFDDLKNHPYLKYKQVNAIIQFRKQHGNYGNIADLKKVAILSAETIEKLAPYISF
ncbi:DNA uptake protein ComE-like DNA-binding protein [Pedobacter cryoconitis]|uniref:DNA uptake protein ComE-like DNA-binding protein n=1 Tax=Pedobacter cryoconitis TaxID=188932 RepID=A0A7W9DYN4_9SPHI|nr:helix-hairpin-helix domain-containing protein [Pedobacter cryoconitis]MBB5636188.1 DNA uptake protein ComE-like DNA-binding protein [Pedobacter cryoconitis]